MKVIVPMAGNGSRFLTNGYKTPKPLIEFNGKTMIQHVIEHVGLHRNDDIEHIFLCQKSHIKDYDLHKLFRSFMLRFTIVEVDGMTDGAATTVSLASKVVRAIDEVIILNSDQLITWDKNFSAMRENAGTIYCFRGEGPKWSYASVNSVGFVTEVAEKRQISEFATAGMYYFKHFGHYLNAYRTMVAFNDRTNNEFYVAPVYNYMLQLGVKIRHVISVDQVGTPEELDAYLLRIS